MFKILVLKSMYNLSDDKMEEQIRNRLSFQHFLGLTRADKIPDARTIWLFGEEIRCANVERKLFERFQEALAGKGLVAKARSIVDGTFVEVPKQRNRREENAQIKRGGIPESFTQNPHKKSHKDVDARWTKKNNASYFGYKNHVNADVRYKFRASFPN